MKVLRQELFLRKDFAFYDSGVLPVLGLGTIAVYDILRRFVWRKKSTDREIRNLQRQYLVTKVSQTTVAQHLGFSRRQTVNEHVATMKKLKWLRVENLPGGSTVYILGDLLGDSEGRVHEAFFADAWMADLWTFLDRAAKDEDEEFEVRDLLVETRIELVEKYITEQVGGCPFKRTGGVRTNGQDESVTASTLNRENINRKNNNSSSPIGDELNEDSPLDENDHAGADSRKQIAQDAINRSVARAKAGIQANRAKQASKIRNNASRTATKRTAMSKPELKQLEERWLELESVYFDDTVTAKKWLVREKANAKALMELYDADVLKQAFVYVFDCWKQISDRMLKGKGVKPTVGFILRFHSTVMVEAQLWAQYSLAKREMDRWLKDNPADPYPPEELDKRFRRLRDQVKALGIDV